MMTDFENPFENEPRPSTPAVTPPTTPPAAATPRVLPTEVPNWREPLPTAPPGASIHDDAGLGPASASIHDEGPSDSSSIIGFDPISESSVSHEPAAPRPPAETATPGFENPFAVSPPAATGNWTPAEEDLGEFIQAPAPQPSRPAPAASRPTEPKNPTSAQSAFQAGKTLPAAPENKSVMVNLGPLGQMPADKLVPILLSWASLATLLALYFWSRTPGPIGPLENLPDDGYYKSAIDIPTQVILAHQLVPFGETRQIGNLKVRPISIRSTKVTRQLATLKPHTTREPVLVLTLEVQNIAPKQAFYPFDPAFLYFVRPEGNRWNSKQLAQFNRSQGYTYTFIHSASGKLDTLVLPLDVDYEQDERVLGQEFPKLAPNQTATIEIYANEDSVNHKLFKQGDQFIWRVKLRKGISRSGKGVATVIGIPFSKSDYLRPETLRSQGQMTQVPRTLGRHPSLL